MSSCQKPLIECLGEFSTITYIYDSDSAEFQNFPSLRYFVREKKFTTTIYLGSLLWLVVNECNTVGREMCIFVQ